MVFFHGGGFIFGRTDVSHLGPDYLLDKDVILVTINYRIGVFGFLSTGDEEAPGNFALKDQKLALQWIQVNILAFGGDPKQVTLFGQSAGATSIHFHALVNYKEKLFHRYILESGTALASWWYHDPKEYPESAKKLATLNDCPTNCTSEMVDCLRGIDSLKLLNTSMSQFTYMDFVFSSMWGPTKEPDLPGAFLTECPRDLLGKNQQKDLPFIIGSTQNEGLLMRSEVQFIVYELMKSSISNLKS